MRRARIDATREAILARLSEEGVSVRSASSTVEASVARRLRESCQLGEDVTAPSPTDVQEPPYVYVREKASPAAHHLDYLNDRADEALCGHGYLDPITLGEVTRPKAVCRACQARLPEYHAKWWREQFRALNSEHQALRLKYRKLEERSR